MPTTKQQLSLLSGTNRQAAIQSIIDYFATELDETIGIIAAEDLLDVFLESAGAAIYNQAVEDAKKMITQAQETLIAELELNLKKQTSTR